MPHHDAPAVRRRGVSSYSRAVNACRSSAAINPRAKNSPSQSSDDNLDMHRLATSVAVTLVLFAVVSCQLPCTSQLQLLPQFAHLFTHCECTLTQWSEWVQTESMPVPVSQCPSGVSLTEQRRRVVISGSCSDETETRNVCI